MDWMPQAVRDGVIVILVISGPIVLIAAVIGLLVGILQAATQVQEQTIGSALKILGVFALIIASGYWMFGYLNQYAKRTMTTAFTFVPAQTKKVISKRTSIYNNANPSEPSYPQLPPLNMGGLDESEVDFARGPGGSNVLGARKPKIEPLREVTQAPQRNALNGDDEDGEGFDEGYQELVPFDFE